MPRHYVFSISGSDLKFIRCDCGAPLPHGHLHHRANGLGPIPFHTIPGLMRLLIAICGEDDPDLGRLENEMRDAGLTTCKYESEEAHIDTFIKELAAFRYTRKIHQA